MIVLWRKIGEKVWIGNTCVKIEKVTTGGRIRLAIEPSNDVMILRDELRRGENTEKAK